MKTIHFNIRGTINLYMIHLAIYVGIMSKREPNSLVDLSSIGFLCGGGGGGG